MIVDNADDVSWGIQKILPKGKRGSVLITSQDQQSVQMLPGACEQVQVGAMSPVEGAALLLRHLGLDAESASEDIRRGCEEVADNLGHLALAIELAGAYIGSDRTPRQALTRYLVDYNRHRDELLKMDDFRGLLPTEKTVWTVWDTTLDKITKKYTDLKPNILLTFVAHFRGSIVQDELFRLASLGMAAVDAELDDDASEGIPVDLRQYVPVDERKEWDSFRYRQTRDVLVRYSLLQRVEGEWAGLTMHRLVQWRTTRNEPSGRWRRWHMAFILAVCCQIMEEQHRPEFRRHLIAHLPEISEDDVDGDKISTRHRGVIGTVVGRIYNHEGRWKKAEKLLAQAMETFKMKLGADHPDTLTIMGNLASTYTNQGRLEEAERLEVQVMEIRKTKLGADHPDTLTSMGNLAATYQKQGRWEEAEKLEVQVMETRKMKLGADHPDTLTSMSNLASTFRNQGRLEEAEKLEVQVMETRKTKLGVDHPDTLMSMGNLAATYLNQGQWGEAEKLGTQVIEIRKTKLAGRPPRHVDEHGQPGVDTLEPKLMFWEKRGQKTGGLGTQKRAPLFPLLVLSVLRKR